MPPIEGTAGHGVRFSDALRFWIKLGFISFGGPAGQIAIMHRELVTGRHWIGEQRFLHALNYCMLLPGPEAQQLATYVGWLLHRTAGGLAAGLFFVLPSVFILLGLSYIYATYGETRWVAGLLTGFKPVVVAIVVEAVIRIGRRALRRNVHFALAAAAFVGIYLLGIPFPLIVIGAGLVGLVGGNLWPDWFAAPKASGANASRTGGPTATAAAIGDDAPAPAHTLPSRRRALAVAAIGLAMWLVPYSALVALRGWDALHAQQYRFFTGAALVTFGGAYAVLAYVTQAATGALGWLTQGQAIDGLALAETTPGPLIMVLQFVGFMAGWQHPAELGAVLSGVLGAAVTTYTTFLPCFVFIFLGAPYIEALRNNATLTNALSGVTAAVVGVVLNLALVFGAAVVWPAGWGAGTNWIAIAMSAAALVLLTRFHVDVVWVVLGGGALGLAGTWLAG
jgi:chromate transporter